MKRDIKERKCDQCGKVDSACGQLFGAPWFAGWIEVSTVGDPDKADFCSKECLIARYNPTVTLRPMPEKKRASLIALADAESKTQHSPILVGGQINPEVTMSDGSDTRFDDCGGSTVAVRCTCACHIVNPDCDDVGALGLADSVATLRAREACATPGECCEESCCPACEGRGWCADLEDRWTCERCRGAKTVTRRKSNAT